MQDRICQVDETSCNARPDHTFGSIQQNPPSTVTTPPVMSRLITCDSGDHDSKRSVALPRWVNRVGLTRGPLLPAYPN